MTFKVNQWMTFMRKGRAFIVGILLYAVGYGVLTMSNSFWMLCLVMVIATIGELIYSPIHNAQRFLMIPADKRGTYSAMETICFFGSEILARFGLILGSILLSWQMSIYVVILILLGGALMYIALFKTHIFQVNKACISIIFLRVGYTKRSTLISIRCVHNMHRITSSLKP